MDTIFGLLGVIVGFLLSEIAQTWREERRIGQAKDALINELRSLRAEIPQLRDACIRTSVALRRGELPSAQAVPAITAAYDAYFPILHEQLSVKERNCLHIIYSRLKAADRVLSDIERDLTAAMAQGMYEDPFGVFADRLSAVCDTYDVIDELIKSFLDGRPVDVFPVKKK